MIKKLSKNNQWTYENVYKNKGVFLDAQLFSLTDFPKQKKHILKYYGSSAIKTSRQINFKTNLSVHVTVHFYFLLHLLFTGTE